MQPSSARGPKGLNPVVLEYMSAESPTVTHLRGSVLVATFQAMSTASLYDRYLARLAASSRDELTNALAMSWVASEHVLAHCTAGDGLALNERALHDLGRLIADHMGESSLNAMWRNAQVMGVGSAWWVIKQAERLWPRLYRGGGCTVLELGPKDAIFEAHNVPMLESPFFRACHFGFMLGISKLIGSTCYVKAVSPRVPHPHRVAISFSWV